MNTFRMPTAPMDVGSGTPGAYARMAMACVLAGVAVFACCFALGRAERPAAAPAEPLPPRVPATAAGTAIPVVLSSASPIQVQQAKVSAVPAPVPDHSPSVGNTGAARTPSTSSNSSAVAPSVTTSPPPATAAPVSPTPTKSSGPSSTGGTSTPSAGKGVSSPNGRPAKKSEASSGTSFDSSG